MRSRARAGFTLLEVMLAMSALALVSAICYAAFHLGIRAVERGEIAVVTAQRLRVASDVLIRQVKSAVPYPARDEDENVYPYFFGNPTAMTFVTAAGLQGGGGLVRVSYRLETDPPRLVLEETPFLSPDALGRKRFEPVDARKAVILQNFKDLKFQYFFWDGTGDVSDKDNWRSDWDPREEDMLPLAVRIRIDGVPGLENDAFYQTVPLMAATYGSDGAGGEVDEDGLQDRALDMARDAERMNRARGGAGATDGERADESDDGDEGDE